MNTKIIMTLSAVIMGAFGVLLTFAAEEVAKVLIAEPNKQVQLLIQVVGALYFAFAMLNWMVKDNLIGGIYNRPIAVANCTHFTIAGLALVKGAAAIPGMPYQWLCVAALYAVFALVFAIILFRHPTEEQKSV